MTPCEKRNISVGSKGTFKVDRDHSVRKGTRVEVVYDNGTHFPTVKALNGNSQSGFRCFIGQITFDHESATTSLPQRHLSPGMHGVIEKEERIGDLVFPQGSKVTLIEVTDDEALVVFYPTKDHTAMLVYIPKSNFIPT